MQLIDTFCFCLTGKIGIAMPPSSRTLQVNSSLESTVELLLVCYFFSNVGK